MLSGAVLMSSRQIPASFGVHGPGDSTIASGAFAPQGGGSHSSVLFE